MRPVLILSALVVAGLAASQPALAQPQPDRPAPECRQDHRKCPEPPEKHRKAPPEARRDDGPRRVPPAEMRREARPDKHHDRRHDLRVGDSAREGRPFRPSRDSHLRPAPHGQEYRVIGDQVVLVDKKHHRIVSVIGPLRR